MKRFSRRDLESVWAGIGTYLLILSAACATNGFAELGDTLQAFFSADPDALLRTGTTLLDAIPISAAVLVVGLPLAVIVAEIVHRLPHVPPTTLTQPWGWTRQQLKRLGLSLRDDEPKSGRQVFASYFLVIFLEEVFARWLFLGVLYWLVSFLPYPTIKLVCFYSLFLLGNGLWSLAHLGNYEREFGRSILWVAPQFLMGVFLTIIYWRYGFWAALIAHFAYDAMIWSAQKRQTTDASDLFHLMFSAGYAVGFFVLLHQDPREIVAWLSEGKSFVLPGWDWWEFTKLCLCYQGLSGVIFGLLLYDQSGSEKAPSTNAVLGGGCSSILACYVAFWALQGIAGSAPIAVVIYALLRTFQSTDTSINAMCRTFWSAVPFAGIVICSIQALPFLSAFWFLLMTSLLLLPLALLERAARAR